MINTLTLNPSLDYIMQVEDFKTDIVNRSTKENMYVGGKGINVSIILSNLGIKSRALGYIAGFTGDEISNRINRLGIENNFIKLEKGLSRINVKLKSDDETEINGNGPQITAEAIIDLYKKVDDLQEGDFLVLAGSIPSSVPSDIYKQIMLRLQDKSVEFVVDATKDLLLNVLEHRPFLIKPNHHELGEIFGVTLTTKEEIIDYAKKLQDKGAQNVLISRAADGAILVDKNGTVYEHPGIKGRVKNSVGAGDSMVAGFIAGYLKNNNYEEAFKMGIAAGSATAFTEDLATKEEIEVIYSQL